MRGRPFEPGNKFGKGRPRGSPNKKSLLLQQMLLDQGQEIVQSVIDSANKGDRTAQTLCMDRLIPPLKPVSELAVEQSSGLPTIEVVLVKPTFDEAKFNELTKPGAPKLPPDELKRLVFRK